MSVEQHTSRPAFAAILFVTVFGAANVCVRAMNAVKRR